jgi:hypothetical protein
MGDKKGRNLPTLCMLDKQIEKVCCGGNYVLVIITKDNYHRNVPTLCMVDKNIEDIFCNYGSNHYGKLGLGDDIARNVPTLCMTDKNIKKIYFGVYHCIGNNWRGQLCLGDKQNRNTLTLCITDHNILDIFCGSYYTFIYRSTNEVLIFGNNYQTDINRKSDLDPRVLNLNTIDNTKDISFYSNAQEYRHIPLSHIRPDLSDSIDDDIREILGETYDYMIHKNNGQSYISGEGDQLDDHILSINNKIVSKIIWNIKIYQTLSSRRNVEILTFLSVCYKIKKYVNIPKDMRNVIISFLF